MTRFNITVFVAAILGLCATSRGQSPSPEQSIEEAAMTSDPQVVINHLPTVLQERWGNVPPAMRAEWLDRLLIVKKLESEGMKVRRIDGDGGWEILKKDGQGQATIRWQSTFISGPDALVRLEVTERKEKEVFLVGLHLEGDEWRITELGLWEARSVDSLFPAPESLESPRESGATATLKALNSTLAAYAATYPAIGYPSHLASLSGTRGQEASSEHALLADQTLIDPMIRSGYQFRYVFTSPTRYCITATPVEPGNTGERSFFTDETRVIRSTRENREARATDPAVQ
jgi:hypothetical protein